jgi:hypothetical protein
MGPMQSRQADRGLSAKGRGFPELFPKLNRYNTLADTTTQLPGSGPTEFFTVDIAVH